MKKAKIPEELKRICPGCGFKIRESSFDFAKRRLLDYLMPKCRCGMSWMDFKKETIS